MSIELVVSGLSIEVEKPVCVNYRGHELGGQRIDLLMSGLVVVELKAVKALDDAHVAQVLSYLKTTQLRLGLLINFNQIKVRDGIRRVVL
jgi:GxxExxY protein